MQSDFCKTGRLCRKIDIFVKVDGNWEYKCSTNWWRLCRTAKQNWCEVNPQVKPEEVRAQFRFRY